MADQLAFDWPGREALGADDFFVTPANAAAHAAVMDPDGWPGGRLALIGPPGSGKTHLARLFRQATGAELRQASEIAAGTPLPAGPILIVEDAEALPGAAEEWLFHAHNHLVGPGRGGRLLLIATVAPARWDVALPDLVSRLAAFPVTRIEEPDDTLLSAVLMKQFQDRQLSPSPAAMSAMLRHVERSFAAVRALVAELDATALAEGRPITSHLVHRVLDKQGREAQ